MGSKMDGRRVEGEHEAIHAPAADDEPGDTGRGQEGGLDPIVMIGRRQARKAAIAERLAVTWAD